MLRQLEYQERVLRSIDWYLATLRVKRAEAAEAQKVIDENPGVSIEPPDFTMETYKELKAGNKLSPAWVAKGFSKRRDGCGSPVPNITLKVPTGGGKTWLAVNALSRIMGQYVGGNTGFVLWIVPNDAIYSQTLKNLRNRDHPYRQALDRAAAGRVKIMEKMDRLDNRDVEANLCLMLLMLQSANRKTKDTLKIFNDRGDVAGFVPAEGEQDQHRALIRQVPNLDGYEGLYPQVLASLGNALRIIQPVVVLDEGQKATSNLATETLYGFNPSFVLELTATPKDLAPNKKDPEDEGRHANVLVEVTGVDVHREGMIKMPLNLVPRAGNDWHATLNSAVSQLNRVAKAAGVHMAESKHYIRPIMLVQVERTGAETRGDGHIHALDAKEWLLKNGFAADEVAIKTADTNELSQPENQDLLSPTNRIRVIITKQALQEGWDCPFAYVLCSLAASSSISAMTQLIGRVLRQPYATKTGNALLDECHVITHYGETRELVRAIKQGLEQDGLGDLTIQLHGDHKSSEPGIIRPINRRPEFVDEQILLPKVMIRAEGRLRDLDYETDILSRIDWRSFDVSRFVKKVAKFDEGKVTPIQKIGFRDDGQIVATKAVVGKSEPESFDPCQMVQAISNILPNAFIAMEMINAISTRLKSVGFSDEKLGLLSGPITDALRKWLEDSRDKAAEGYFRSALREGDIQYRLRLDGRNWRMPDQLTTTEPTQGTQVVKNRQFLTEKSLFERVYERELNRGEQAVAIYLDDQDRIRWWHRNAARAHYGVQGWKRSVVYPDFVFLTGGEDEPPQLFAIETKGDQLAFNLDSEYKRNLLETLREHFEWDASSPIGELELVKQDGTTVDCRLVLMTEWREVLSPLINS